MITVEIIRAITKDASVGAYETMRFPFPSKRINLLEMKEESII